MGVRPPVTQDRPMEDVQQHDGGIDVAAPAMWPVEEREAWSTALRATGPPHDEAVAALYELLVRGARSEISRRWADLGYVDDDAVDELATQAADDALLALLSKLDRYRGDSRFTTWACKFAILEAGLRARRRAWHRRDVVLNSESCKRRTPLQTAPRASTAATERAGGGRRIAGRASRADRSAGARGRHARARSAVC
jgi:DNA-directed RNA polymerase specialized sigma24 family protein